MAKFLRFSLLCLAGLVITATLSPAFALRMKDGEVILDKLEDYQLCQSKDYSGDFCHDALKRWVDQHPNDAFKAGKATRRAMNSWVAIPFFAQAFKAKMGDCKDEDVHLAVVSALGLPADSHAEVVKQAKSIGFEACFSETKEMINKEAKLGSYNFKNSCKGLAAKGALPPLKKKKCDELK